MALRRGSGDFREDPSIAEFNTYVTVEQSTKEDDGMGGFTESWSTRGETWAYHEIRTGRQRREGKRRDLEQTHLFYLRHDPGVEQDDRLQVSDADSPLTVTEIRRPLAESISHTEVVVEASEEVD